MSETNAQKTHLQDWQRGRELSSENLNETVHRVRALSESIGLPQGVPESSIGINLFRVTEVVDVTADPIIWTIKAVRVNDVFDTSDILEAIEQERTFKLPEGTFGVAVGDLVTEAKTAKNQNQKLAYPISKAPLLYKATADESGGEITGKAMKLDLSTVGVERTFKTLP